MTKRTTISKMATLYPVGEQSRDSPCVKEVNHVSKPENSRRNSNSGNYGNKRSILTVIVNRQLKLVEAVSSTAHFLNKCPLRFCQACRGKGHDHWHPEMSEEVMNR